MEVEGVKRPNNPRPKPSSSSSRPPTPTASVSKSGDRVKTRSKWSASRVKKKLKLWAVALLLAGALALAGHRLYLANGRKAASVGCLWSLISRCNPLLERSPLSGVLWHDCDGYCNKCRGSTFGMCPRTEHEDCFGERGWSRRCFCYGSRGVRDGNCWS